jgi:uncharacterized protein YfaS (alpha-2-macroglobulin family)
MKKRKRMASVVLVVSFVVGATLATGPMPGRVSAHTVQSCEHQKPNVVVTPDQMMSFEAGDQAFTTVFVTNLDHQDCGPSSFSLQATMPEGWIAALDDTTLTVNPGESAATTLRITSPATLDAGIHSFQVSAQNSVDASCIDVSPVIFALATSIDVTLAVQQTTTTGTVLPIMADVRALEIGVAGADVTFDIICPDGQVLHYELESGQEGATGIKLELGDQAPLGTYVVKASAEIKGISGSAVMSFTVEGSAKKKKKNKH